MDKRKSSTENQQENSMLLAALARNRWQVCPGISGKFAQEWVAGFGRNLHKSAFANESHYRRPFFTIG